MSAEIQEQYTSPLGGTASLEIRHHRNGAFVVIAYLPPGIDLMPMLFGRYATLEDAQAHLPRARTQVKYL